MINLNVQLMCVAKIFKGFPYESLCKILGPRGEAIFGPRAMI